MEILTLFHGKESMGYLSRQINKKYNEHEIIVSGVLNGPLSCTIKLYLDGNLVDESSIHLMHLLFSLKGHTHVLRGCLDSGEKVSATLVLSLIKCPLYVIHIDDLEIYNERGTYGGL